MADTIKIRRDIEANWNAVASTCILAEGEIGIITDKSPLQCKVGNGTSNWQSLKAQAWTDPGSVDRLAESLSELEANTSYVTCSSASGSAAKVVSLSDFELTTHCRLVVRMAEKNVAASPTLNVNGTGAIPLWFDGALASADNSWSDEDTLDIYYDGTVYNSVTLKEPKFGSGQRLNTVKIKDETGDEVYGTAGVLSAEAGRNVVMINGTDLTKYLKPNCYVNTGGGGINIGDVINLSPITLANFGSIVVPYIKGKQINITGQGGSTPRLWAFLDNDKKLLTRATGNAQNTMDNGYISNNQDGWLVVNFKTDEEYSLAVIANVLPSDIAEIEEEVIDTKLRLNAHMVENYGNIVGGTENFIDLDLQTGDNIIEGTYMKVNGNLATSPYFYYSSFIPVVSNFTYKAVRVGNPNYGCLGAFYGIDKQFMGVIDYGGAETPISPNEVTFTTPVNCCYIRLNMFSGGNAQNKMLIKADSATEPYRDYGYKYKPISNRITDTSAIVAEILGNVLSFYGKIGSFIGDSITWGYVPHEAGEPVSRYDENTRWVSVVGKKLGLSTINEYGISGSTIAVKETDPSTRNPMVNRLNTINSNSDLIVIAGGTNDWAHNWTPFGDTEIDVGVNATKYTFCGALDIMCRELIDMFPTKKIAFLCPIKRNDSGENSLGKTLLDYVNAIKTVCGRYSVPMFDAYHNITINPQILTQKTQLIPDGTHPNANGHAVMAQSIFGFLNNI